MSSKIKAIQKDIVHKICSGQVVLNLATAIKELVENSLDARATTIDVRLREYGSELIEVVDNGTGIHPDNFQALTLKHHTSKLSDFSDLINVETFGFRGEALSSLCAVSDIVVTTRHESEKCATKLNFDYLGILQNSQPCPRQVGTTVTLTNLFSSLPVRQKEFHRNLKKEFNKAVQLLSAYCLIATNVKITCVNQTKKGGRLTFLSTQENKTIRDNISCVFGSKQLSNLLEIVTKPPNEDILQEFSVKNVTNSFQLEGYVSSCHHGSGRSSTDRQFYFINSRPCEPSKVTKLVNEIYHQFNLHQFPFILMNIMVAKQTVDVNVTPDKRMIFLQNENLLLATVKSTLVSLFESIPSTYKINNPLSSLPPRNLDQAETRKKFSLSALDKWRHVNDKNTSDSHKRSSQEFPQPPTFKQMKLDIFQKANVTSQSPTKNKSESDLIDLEPEENTDQDDTLDQSDFQMEYEHIFEETDIKNEEIETPILKIIEDQTESSNSTDDLSISTRLNEECDIERTNSSENSHNSQMTYHAYNLINDQEYVTNESISECFDDIEAVDSSLRIKTEIPSAMETCVEVCVDLNEYRDDRRFVTVNTCLEEIGRMFRRNKVGKTNTQTIINKFHVEIDPDKNQLAEEELSKAISKDMFLKMKIIGQFNLGFIITRLENDLFIVDQHATDEKYNFETLQQTTTLKCQKLVVPQNLDLTVTNECILIDNIDVLKKNGFEFSVDFTAEATKRVKLISIPVSHNWQFGKEDIDEMLFMLQDSPNTLCRPSRIRAMFASRACRKSVMIGTPLSISDMKRLITHMSEIEHPWNCPHGRPTMRHVINLSLLD